MIHDSSTPPGEHAPYYIEPYTPSSGCQWTSINTLMFDVLRSDTPIVSTEPVLILALKPNHHSAHSHKPHS